MSRCDSLFCPRRLNSTGLPLEAGTPVVKTAGQTMSGTHQSNGNQAEQAPERAERMSGLGAILWEVGADPTVADDTVVQLRETYRRACARGKIEEVESR